MVKFWQQIIWISFVSKREIVCYSIRRFYYEFIKWEERVVKIMTRRQLVFLSRNQTPLIQVKVKKRKAAKSRDMRRKKKKKPKQIFTWFIKNEIGSERFALSWTRWAAISIKLAFQENNIYNASYSPLWWHWSHHRQQRYSEI